MDAETITNAIRKLRNLDMTGAPEVYAVFATDDKRLIQDAAKAVMYLLERLDTAQIMRLEKLFRQHTSLNWYVDWYNMEPNAFRKDMDDVTYQWVIKLGTFHPNGYFREKCLRGLADIPENLPYLLLRINDWVEPVKELAMTKALRAVTCMPVRIEALIRAIPFLDRLEDRVKSGISQRDSSHTGIPCSDLRFYKEEMALLSLQEKLLHQINQEFTHVYNEMVMTLDRTSRKALYSRLGKSIFIRAQWIKEWIVLEKCSYLKKILTDVVLRSGECTPEEIEQFLSDKSVVVRKSALQYKYAVWKDSWTGAERMLLDSARGIRQLICYILQKHTNTDILSYYKEMLEKAAETLTTAQCKAAILGIGENGSPDTVSVILPYLQHESGSLAASALKAYAMLVREKGADLYWQFLFDSRLTVAKQAYLAIRRNEVHYGAAQIMNAFCHSQGGTRCYLLKMLLCEPSWERLPFLLQLYHYEENPVMQDKIRNAVNTRSIYAKITAAQAAEIREIMSRKELEIPRSIQDHIAFDLCHISIK